MPWLNRTYQAAKMRRVVVIHEGIRIQLRQFRPSTVRHFADSPSATTYPVKSVEQENIMPTGASPKREREYKKLERKFKKEGRYAGREEEVASRIVNKQRAEAGETKTRHRPPSRSASRRKTRTSRTATRRRTSS
jgi:hypothetical protein